MEAFKQLGKAWRASDDFTAFYKTIYHLNQSTTHLPAFLAFQFPRHCQEHPKQIKNLLAFKPKGKAKNQSLRYFLSILPHDWHIIAEVRIESSPKTWSIFPLQFTTREFQNELEKSRSSN